MKKILLTFAAFLISTVVMSQTEDKVFDVVEEPPSYPGGMGALMQFLSSNIKYPVEAEENGIQGRVICTFVVEKDGSITDVKVAKSVALSIDNEAMRVINSMPNWSPGKQNGALVRVKYTLPITFRLSVSSKTDTDIINIDGIYYKLSGTEATVISGDTKYMGSVTIPATITFGGITYSIKSIGQHAFSNCPDLTSVTINNGITEIGIWAFSDCKGLTSVTIPNSVTSIKDGAFNGCSSLKSVKIPDSVTEICSSAFSSCSSLTSVIIPNSVKTIGAYAFSNCSGLTSVTIPNSVTSIKDGAFNGCSSLTSITIPKNVTSIGYSSFEGCDGLTSIVVENGNTKYDSRNNCNGIIETATNILIARCKNTVIPDKVNIFVKVKSSMKFVAPVILPDD